MNLLKRPGPNGRLYWRAHWTEDGVRKSKGLGPADGPDRVSKADAKRAMERLRVGSDPEPVQIPCSPALVRLLEDGAEARSHDKTQCMSWLRTASLVRDYFGGADLESITRKQATDFRNHLGTLNLSEQTCRHHIARIRAAINEQIRNETGGVAANRFDHIPSGVIRRDKSWEYVSAETVMKMSGVYDDDDVANAILLARLAGLRANEIDRLEWADMDRERGLIRVRNPNAGGKRTTKKRERWVPISQTLDFYLFSADGFSIGHGRVLEHDTAWVRSRFPAACRAAGVEPWPEPLQTLRRCCISDWCSSGISVADVAEIAGNSTQVIMDHYFKVNPATLAAISGRSGARDELLAAIRGMSDADARRVLDAIRGMKDVQEHVDSTPQPCYHSGGKQETSP